MDFNPRTARSGSNNSKGSAGSRLDEAEDKDDNVYNNPDKAAACAMEYVRQGFTAVKLDPANGEAMLNLAILLSTSGKSGDLKAATAWYDKALAAGAARDEGLDRVLRRKTDEKESP